MHGKTGFIILQETTSTMDEAMALARKGCPDFTVAVAQRQTRGRGRMQRSWLSTRWRPLFHRCGSAGYSHDAPVW
jgi:biotin-(acetyl-CoA carboxylase) ligase